MKGPGTIFETEFASVVALPRRGEKSLRFAPFPVRLGSRERLLLFLGAEFKEREREGGEKRISMVIEDGTIDPPLHSLCCKGILDRLLSNDQFYSTTSPFFTLF